MDVDTIKMLFEGNERNVLYYNKLRNILSTMREDGEICFCDPYDNIMVERIKRTGWEPKSTPKVTEDILYLDGNLHGYRSKQTAVDDLEPQENAECAQQVAATDRMELEDPTSSGHGVFECGHQGCPKVFSSLAAYESHYHSCHHYTCVTCKRVFVSSFMLDIHIQENHDSYFQILCSRIDMYRCLVERCEQKFRTADQRRQHLVAQHKFPANFAFHKPVSDRAKGIVGEGMDTSSPVDDQRTVVDSNTGMSVPERSEQLQPGARAKKVPSTVCFGRGSQRSFQRRPRGKKRIQVDAQMEQR